MCIKWICSELLEIEEGNISKADFLLDPKTPWIHFMNETWQLVGDKGLLNQFLKSEEIFSIISHRYGYSPEKKIHIVRFTFLGRIVGILEVHSKLLEEEKRTKAYLASLRQEDISSC